MIKENQQAFKATLVNFIGYIDDPLFAQTKATWDSFRVSRIRSSQNNLLSAENSKFADESCLQFFSPPNIRRFISLFWDEWYPHCPIIHRAAFDILCAPAILLVPMAIIGACMSPHAGEVSLAKKWLEFGEELVFSSTILSAEPAERDVSETDVPPLKILQAAYIICILLNWEGSDTMKRRVRNHRFAAVVSVGNRDSIGSCSCLADTVL